MRLLAWLRLWLRALLRRDRVESDIRKELQFHIDRETELNIARGIPPHDARRAALIAFGGVEQTKEAVRDERRTLWLEQLIADARFAMRSLRRRPAFAIVAIVSIALSIGATTAIYTLVDSVLFRTIPARGVLHTPHSKRKDTPRAALDAHRARYGHADYRTSRSACSQSSSSLPDAPPRSRERK